MLLWAGGFMPSLAAHVRLRYRVAQRYLAARDLPMGKTFQNELVRIWHGREILRVTDLTNAGKRGKTCTELRVTLTVNYEGDPLAWFDDVADSLLEHAGRGFLAVRDYIAFLKNEDPAAVAIDVEKLKSINVEPYGEIFEFRIKQPNKGYIEVKSSPIDFRVTDHHYMGHPTDPTKGGFFQDTSYWPRKKKDAMTFYAWMKDNHERAQRFIGMDMFRKTWTALDVTYDSH